MMRMFMLIRWRGCDDECTCGHKMKEACNDENVRVNKMEGCDDEVYVWA